MSKETQAYLVKETQLLLDAPMSCPEAKAEAKAWLAALGTAKEKEETKRYFKELKEDITSIDDLVAFASSPYAEKEFGVEGAKAFLAHAKEIKAKGAKHCDCPACSAAAAILAKKDEALK